MDHVNDDDIAHLAQSNTVATLDLDKRWGWQGTTFQFTMTDRNGRNLGADADIGNNMLIQEV